MKRPKGLDLLAAAALLLVSFGVYTNSLSGDFLIDDTTGILDNESIHDAGQYFSRSFRIKPGILYEVLRVLTWQVSRDNPFYYHLFNVAFHAGCVILLFFICRFLFRNPALSFLSSLIFALHPIHTEAISWISAGHYPFSSLFFMAAFFFYIQADRSILYLALAVFFSALCVFSGNAFVMLPLMCIMYEVFFREKPREEKPLIAGVTLRRFRLFTLLILIGIGVLFLGMYAVTRNKFAHLIFYYRGLKYLIVIAKAFLYYLKILYLPLARGLYHPFAFNTTRIQEVSPAFFVSLAACALFVFAFFRCRKKAAAVSFGIGWFCVAYAPYSNLIPVCNIISERYLYLPSVGFSIMMAALFLKAWEVINTAAVRKAWLRWCAVGAVTAYLGSYAALTLKRNYEYTNIMTFWETNIENFPDGYIVYNNLAGTFYAMGKPESALGYCLINLMVNPRQPHVWCNLGKLYREKGDLREAASCYEEAVKIDGGYFPALKALEEIRREQRADIPKTAK